MKPSLLRFLFTIGIISSAVIKDPYLMGMNGLFLIALEIYNGAEKICWALFRNRP